VGALKATQMRFWFMSWKGRLSSAVSLAARMRSSPGVAAVPQFQVGRLAAGPVVGGVMRRGGRRSEELRKVRNTVVGDDDATCGLTPERRAARLLGSAEWTFWPQG
jgi:hypothetical protein